MSETIKICENHDYEVPLIYTFAFIGAEYWCPYCGYTGGMFGSGKDVKVTEKLMGRLYLYKQHSKAMLDATGGLICCARKLNGGKIKPENYPENMRKELVEMAKNWEYNKRATSLLKKDIMDCLEFKCVDCVYFEGCKDYKKSDIEICDKWKREED